MTIHLPKKGSGAGIDSPYAPLGLRDLPFPNDPVVDPYNQDARRNGTIYAESTATEAIKKFERLLIRPDDFPNRVRLAYLWSKGDSESGRGVGKTALLRYFRQQINRDWGQTVFRGQFSAAVIYVAFRQQVDRRYMEQLALSALVDVCKCRILDSSRAALRLAELDEDSAAAVLTTSDGDQAPGNLLDEEILRAKGVDPAALDSAVAATLRRSGVEAPVAKALAEGRFEDYLRSLRRDGCLEPLYVPRDTRILDLSRTLMFNDVVKYLRAAGFAGGYLFIDDIENLVDQMARRDRIEFAKNFALCTVRPGYANTEFNFFSSVLTTHQQASVSLSQAWGEAGLSSIARLDPESPNSVELPFPSKDQAKAIVVAHLDHYRIRSDEIGTIRPFTLDGLEALLENRQTVHPRVMLAKAAAVVRHAAEHGLSSINAECVGKIATAAAAMAPDFTEGLDGAM